MKDLTLKELKEILAEWEKDYWVAPKDEDGMTRHITLHLTKLLGKIGGVCEKREHGFEVDKSVIKTDVIPDLLSYALALSKLYNIDLQKAFLDRLEANKVKVKSWENKDKAQG